jgi:hypothetical protein
LKNKVTVITRASGEELARVEWKNFTFEEEVVTMNGETMLLSQLMTQSKELMSRSVKVNGEII